VEGDFQMDDEPVIILSTAGESEAKGIAQALVMQHLAACVNITGVASVYRWKGDLCEDHEQLLIIKTVKGQVAMAMEEIRKLHSYALPEMIVLPLAGGYPPYLQWLAEETRS
jgi:periplasmic divalent cation tolerance protein